MSDATLKAEGLTIAYRDRTVLRELTLALPPGRMTAILGPNGCGKSTLLHALARLLRPAAGRVTLGGRDVHAENTKALARRLAILPQSPTAPDGITVAELVKRGRAPWRGILAPWSARDAAICEAALQAVAMKDLGERPMGELSGGQRQRAWIALALAQDTPVLLLDEPTTFLDLPHQLEVLSLLRRRNREAGTTVVAVLHDLNLAARFCDHLVLLGPHGLVADGAPSGVLTEKHLDDAFALKARVLPDPIVGTPMVVPF